MGTAVGRKCLVCSLGAISVNLPFCAVHHFKLPFELRESLLLGELVKDGVRLLGPDELWAAALGFLRCAAGDRPHSRERQVLDVFVSNELAGEVARVVGRGH
jgi:hypothetical protein